MRTVGHRGAAEEARAELSARRDEAVRQQAAAFLVDWAARRYAQDNAPPIVEVRPDASRASLVLEIRTSDSPGVVHRVLAALARLGLTVASAHVSTLGPQAVDVFYVQEVGGVRPTEERAAAAAHAVRTALGG